MTKKFLFAIFFLTFFGGDIQHSNAAVLSILPVTQDEIRTGQEFAVDLIVDTQEAYINAVQAKITFSNNILELISTEKFGSIFNFWLKEPVISNTEGSLEFIGGTPKGVSGTSLKVLRMKFRVVGIGESKITISDAVVSANDGKGTNVLSDTEDITIINRTGVSAHKENGIKTEIPIVEPQKIVRKPVDDEKRPDAPTIEVNLYADQNKWHNHIGEVVVLWDLPEDITKIATDIDNNPNTDPQTVSDDLSNGKKFGVLHDGVWYIHVQFKNNIGWGKTSHYKISIDTTSPLPFEIGMDNIVSEDPTPQLGYHTHDSLSGISHAQIFIDGELVFVEKEVLTEHISTEFFDEEEWVHIQHETVLGPILPGSHTATVRLFDKAGNGVEDDILFEITPLESPTIASFPKTIDFDGDEFVWGYSLPNVFVTVRIFSKDGDVVFEKIKKSDATGHWMAQIDKIFRKGNYELSVFITDQRGAQSFPTDGIPIKVVRAGDFLSLGFINLSLLEIFLIVLLSITALPQVLSVLKKKRVKSKR